MATQGPNSPGTAANAGIGGDSWLNPTNVTVSDDSRAVASILGTESDYLRVTQFGFTMDDTALIQGIEVAIEWLNTVTGYTVFLQWTGTQRGTAKTGVPPGGETTTTLGGSADLWGAAPTAINVKDSTFGVDIRVSGTGLQSSEIDHVTITITYFDQIPYDIVPFLGKSFQNNQTVLMYMKPEVVAYH